MAAWVEKEAKRANRNLFIVNILLLGVGVTIIAADGRYVLNFLLGCQRIEPAELAALTSATQRTRNFVTVSGSKSARTGYQDVETEQTTSGAELSRSIKDEYVLLQVGDKVLLVKADPGPEKPEYSGELVTTEETVWRIVVLSLSVRDPQLGKMILPFTLNAADYREEGYRVLGVTAPLLLLAGWNILKVFRRQSEPQTTPVWRRLSALGDPQQLSMQIEAEENQLHAKYGRLHVTQTWLLRKKFFSTWVWPVENLAWAYKKLIKRSVHFIPVGTGYAVVLVDRYSERVELQMKEKAVDSLLAHLAARVPSAIYGFDQQIADAWRKDAATFAAVIDARRQASAKAAADAPASRR
jgi:hypothetical protein